MAQQVTIPTAGIFADSTTVKAYLRNQVAERGRKPFGASVAEGTTSAGSVTITGLTEGQEYWVGAEVESKWVLVHVTVPTPTGSANATGKESFASVASANTITLPNADLIEVTGTTEVKKITAGIAGRSVTLLFASTPTVKDGENLKLSADLVATADDTLSLKSNGTNWYETGRSVN